MVKNHAYYCDLCKKEVSRKEAEDSSIAMRKAMKNDDPNIFDIWFGDYCKNCANKYISGEIKSL
jgi:hypothetical protein